MGIIIPISYSYYKNERQCIKMCDLVTKKKKPDIDTVEPVIILAL